MISKRWAKLGDPEYRKAFVASQINIGIPFQIRALMKSRNWTQDDLARRTGMLQPRISTMLKPGKTRPNIETLRRIAEAFDCGLMVRFVPFSALALWSEQFAPDTFDVPSFKAEEKAGMAPQAATVGVVSLLDTTIIDATAFEASGLEAKREWFRVDAKLPVARAVQAQTQDRVHQQI